MRRSTRVCAAAWCLVSWVQAQNGVPLVLTADRPSGSIQLDGKLEEPAWHEARMIVDLVQQSPKPGAASPYRTRVRVLIVDNKLYFGFECTDPEAKAIAVHTM